MALDVASSLLMWDVECAMRVDRKKKKRKMQRVVFAIKDGWKQGWKRYSRHWEISIVKKVVSLFFYSPSPKVIRISLSLEIDPRNIFSFQISLRIERLRDRFRFSKAFVERLNDWRNCFTRENLWKTVNDRTKFDFIALESGVIMLGSCETWAR